MNIDEFIEARLTEDEAIARECEAIHFHAVKRQSGTVDVEGHYHPVEENHGFAWFTHRHPGFPPPYARHICRHDPAHVLRAIATKRRIVVECIEMREMLERWSSYAPHPDLILQAMADEWCEHPDYRTEWNA
ncbi:DUF6221 family protein [Nocardia brasiliensis]|uniref:DUF6221 family protein n=1 Tax=Nocardia brasiliensis TaxID=37326 RepID=UPI003D8A2EB8